MKNFIKVFIVFSVAACTTASETEDLTSEITDNAELVELYDEDQADRKSPNIDWSEVSKRDKLREARVYELLDSNKVNTSQDYSNAAMIFQHGMDTSASGMAVKMMKKALELDSAINKWLLAAAVDRDLMRRNKPQVYGTQYRRDGADSPWYLYELDSTKISDAQRQEYGVETLAQQKEMVRSYNLKRLHDLYESGKTVDDIVLLINTDDETISEYNHTERAINRFGYELIKQQKNDDALIILKLNTELFPDSYNTFDSYGELLMIVGETDKAVVAYKQSLELNPDNESAKKALAEHK